MSKTVDERVVEMRFDNAKFEQNVRTSMSTLDKLKQKLNLSGSAKGLNEIDAAAKKVDMSGLGKGVETVSAKFSALQVMGVTALANITNSAVNAGKRIVSALTIDPVTDGFREYETQMNAVQTILANTQKEGTNVKVVNKALDELNTYADKTIYNFTEMTRNIGTFTAAGVKLDTSISSIKGIANLAAISGSNSQQASTAMYQLSQAIASGTVKLMDWNSVVNAGMGGQVFQDALIRTSEHLNTGAKAAISAEGSFRESLTTGWLTTEVLTQTLDQFATAADTQEEYEAAVKKFVEQGYTQEEAKQMADMAKTAGEAATKVKTFTQLIDTLKEALGSGWSQTWRLIIGDFEEARTLWTSVSDVLSGLINESSEARNNMIQGWADLGGRTALIESFKNSFEAISKIIKPISEAFREVFPRTTSEQLYNLTNGLRNFTKHLIISDETANKIKQTFKGVFSILGIGVDILKTIGRGALSLAKGLFGIDIGLLNVTASIGNWLVNLRESINEMDVFGSKIDKISDFLKNASSKIKESFGISNFDGFIEFFDNLFNVVSTVGSSIIDAIGSIGNGIANVFGNGNFFEALNNGILSGILIYIAKFIKGMKDTFSDGVGVLENIKGILDDVRGCFQAYQEQLKAGALLKIASAIGVLAAAIFVISTIDGDALARSLGGITILFVELIGALAIFNKMNAELKSGIKVIPLMIGMSIAVLILAGAMKKLSSLDWEGIGKGLVGVGFLLTELSIFLRTYKFDGKMAGTALGIVLLSSAMLILAKAVKNFGNMQWMEIGKGLAAIGVLLTEFSLFSKLTNNAKHVISTGLAMVLLGSAIKILASAVKDFSNMNWSEIGRGLTAMGIALTEVAIAMNLMPKRSILIGTRLIVAAAALKILANALSDFGGMSWDEIGKGLTTMGMALVELAVALKIMNGTLSGSAALLIAAGALAIMTPILKSLGSMSWRSIVKGLVALAGAFAVIGIAGALLSPIIPVILSLSAAFALLGVATLGIGIGLTMIAAGITALAAAVSGGVTTIVAGLSAIILGVVELIPTIAIKLAEGVVEFIKVISESASVIAESLLKMLSEVLASLAEYTPKIVDSLMVFIIGVINALADHMPELVQAAMNFIGKFFQGIIDALNGIDTTNLLKTVVAVGLMTGLMYALSGVVALIPSAMTGMIGVGAVIAEMALVLAAIGGLAQIPGLNWLIEEGGDFLEKIGTAIGKFIGGIAGGIAKGATSALPEVGNNLSNFMKSIQPFIDGAKNIDASMLTGVDALTKVILKLTAADLLSGITSWLTGKSSFEDFANQIVIFGKAMKEYSEVVSGIDSSAITSSANAAKALSELANNIPNTGGLVSLFAGDNTLDAFGEQLAPFGKHMKAYADNVTGIDTEAVTASANAAKTLSELAENLPNAGGLVSWFTGDNKLDAFGRQLAPFGECVKAYADSISDIDISAVTASANAAKTLSELANNLPNTGGLVALFTGDNSLSAFGSQLAPFGECMKAYANSVAGIDTESVTASANAAKTLSELANNLTNTGGLVALFTGDNDLSQFGGQLVIFGTGMKSYADSVAGMDTESITNSVNAAKTLVNLMNSLSNSGGFANLFTGETSLANLGQQLVPFGSGMKAYANSVMGIDTESIINSANAANAIVKVANSISKSTNIMTILTGDTSLANLGQQLVPFGKGMKSYGNAVTGINSEAISNSVGATKSLVQVANALNKSGGLVGLITGNSDLSSLGNQLVPFGKSLKQYSVSVSEINAEAISSSATSAKRLVTLINSTAGLNATGVITFKNAVDTLAKTNVKGFINAFKGLTSEITEVGSKLNKALIKGFKFNQAYINEAATSIVNKMHKTIINKTSTFEHAGKMLSEKLKSGLTSKSGSTEKAIGTMLSGCVSKTKSYYSDFFDAGSYLVGGFASGISSNSYKAAAKAKAMAKAAYYAAKEALDINSPSKIFRKLGYSVPEGFAQGIDRLSNYVENSSMSMARTAIAGAEDALAYMSDVINSDSDARPTIRPVIDLSDVKTGVGAISKMFGNSAAIGVQANVNSISNGMMRNRQNGSNDEIISAIGKLEKSIDGIGKPSYTIEGITYDNGSEISDAIETLISAARRERRI